MSQSRLTLALESGAVALPDEGPIAVFNPSAMADLSALPKDRVEVIQGFKPDHDAWAARGYAVAVAPQGTYAGALIFLPRAKAEARALVAQAVAAAAGGPVIIDGQKTDGVDSLLKDCRARSEVSAPLSKAHGKCFSLTAPAAPFADWQAAPALIEGGFRTAPGVFSADKIDRGSALLADALPAKLKGRVADLGAGWGYLSARALAEHPAITEMHLVEADHAALDCARANVTDPRARFHWADATRFTPEAGFDAILSNPPFHTSRAADPALGQAFLAAAARMLTPGGQLWIVANRHLPYEHSLTSLFREVAEAPGGDAGFKILRASRPMAASPRRGR